MTADSSVAKPTVALFGYFKYGNFGDDLMAAIVGRHLARRYPVKVFGPSIRTYEGPDIPGTTSIDDLVDGAEAAVYGGGGAFLRLRGNRPPLPYDSELAAFCEAVKVRDLPLHLVSVGGDGSRPERLTDARQALLEVAGSGTFRNPEDEVLFSKLNGAASVYDDIVWVTPKYFSDQIRLVARDESGVAKGEALVVGIDGHIYRSRLVRLYFGLLKAWSRVARVNTEYRVLWQHRTPAPKAFPRDTVLYRDLDGFVKSITECDLIITSRLHMGLVAMAYGRTVFGVRPSPKQKLLFKRFGRGHLLFDSPKDFLRLFRLLGRRRHGREFIAANKFPSSQERATEASKHLDELDRAMERYISRVD